MKCEICREPAVNIVELVGRSGRVLLRKPVCQVHLEQEQHLAAVGLSMATLRVLPMEEA